MLQLYSKMHPARGFTPVLLILLIVIFLVGLGGAMMVFRAKSSSESTSPSPTIQPTARASIRIVSDKSSYSPGERASFAVFVDSRETPVIGVDFEFSYDPSAITIDQSGVATSEVFPRFLGGFNQTKDFVDPASGTISISGLAASTEHQAKVIVPDQPVVIIQGIVQKSGKLTLEFTKGATDDTNVTQAGESRDILTEVESASFIVQ